MCKPKEFHVEHKGHLYVFAPHPKGGWEVIKGSLDGEEWYGNYYVDEMGCTCPGGVHHGYCWHQNEVSDKPMPIAEGEDPERWLEALKFAKDRDMGNLVKTYEEIIEKKFGKEILEGCIV